MRPLPLMVPELGRVIRDNIFNKVDFPAPFLPTKPTTSPFMISKSMSLRAHNSFILGAMVTFFAGIFLRAGNAFFQKPCKSSLKESDPIIPKR